MIDYQSYGLSFTEAKKEINKFDQEDEPEFKDMIRKWSRFDDSELNYAHVFKDIRGEIVSVFKQALSDSNNQVEYLLDLKVGLKLYELLSVENGFDLIAANDDDVWRYLTIRVFPDLTFIRFPNRKEDLKILQESIPNLSYKGGLAQSEKGSNRFRIKRFYSGTRRIWLKTLWWYVYLGWRENSKETYNVLKNNGTNIISQLIERTGTDGYRTKLFRCLLYTYSLLPEQKQKDYIFSAAAKLNRIKCVTIEPALTEGEEEEYCRELFEEICGQEVFGSDVERNNY